MSAADELVTEIVERLRKIDANDESWSGVYSRAARCIESEFAGRYQGLRLVRDDEATVERMAEAIHEANFPRLPWAETREHDPVIAKIRYRMARAALTAAQRGESDGR